MHLNENRKQSQLSRSQRMQLKAWISLLGILLLLIMMIGKLVCFLLVENKETTIKDPEKGKCEPIITKFENVWIIEGTTEGLYVFRDGFKEYYRMADNATAFDGAKESVIERQTDKGAKGWKECIADVTLADGEVTKIFVKNEKIRGRILGADDTSIEVEGYGRLQLDENYKGYRLYHTLEMCTVNDLIFGYDDTDLCLEHGKVCAVLMVREEKMSDIRVLIKSSDDDSLFHEKIEITADCDFSVRYSLENENYHITYHAGEEICLDGTKELFDGERIQIVPEVLTGKLKVCNLKKVQEEPEYRGRFEVIKTDYGLVLVNEVSLEDYLYCVVPSEMPASYPMEALKAQAICARTYAYGRMLHAGYPVYGAHVDDSTAFQVYNHVAEQINTTTAVKETYGQFLCTDRGEIAETFYYSTSCGVGSDANIWKTEKANLIDYLEAKRLNEKAKEAGCEELTQEDQFREFITVKDPNDFEANESWYRWKYVVKNLNEKQLLDRLKTRYEANPELILTYNGEEYISQTITSPGKIHDICIVKRGAGGVADEMIIEGEKKTYKIVSEYNIRYLLNDGVSNVVRQDGSEVVLKTLLPSGFFVMSTGKEEENVVGYSIIGGGYGHGVGMSQNCAKQMAIAGYSAEEILSFFYHDCTIMNIYDQESQNRDS